MDSDSKPKAQQFFGTIFLISERRELRQIANVCSHVKNPCLTCTVCKRQQWCEQWCEQVKHGLQTQWDLG